MRAKKYEHLRRRLDAAVQSVCPQWLRQMQDDLVQAGIMAVMRIDERREEDLALPASYLRKVAYSAVVDEIRRLRARKEVSFDAVTESRAPTLPGMSDPDRQLAGKQIVQAVRYCLAGLLEPRRHAVTLHLLGYTKPQIALRMGWNRKRASNLVFRGLENLRDCLRRLEVTP